MWFCRFVTGITAGDNLDKIHLFRYLNDTEEFTLIPGDCMSRDFVSLFALIALFKPVRALKLAFKADWYNSRVSVSRRNNFYLHIRSS
jgi:hypothetical protein